MFRGKSAFVLVEVLVSLVIVSSVIAASLMIFTKLADVQRRDSMKRKAIFAARYKLEELVANAYNDLANGTYTSAVDTVLNQPGYFPGATIQWSITEASLTGNAVNDSKRIDVRVSW